MLFQFSVPNAVGRHTPVKEGNIKMTPDGIYNDNLIYKGIVNGREVFFAYNIQYDRGQWQLLFGDPREHYTTTKILHIIDSENVNIDSENVNIDSENIIKSKQYNAYIEFVGEVVVNIHL
jgi:hypothetical protein